MGPSKPSRTTARNGQTWRGNRRSRSRRPESAVALRWLDPKFRRRLRLKPESPHELSLSLRPHHDAPPPSAKFRLSNVIFFQASENYNLQLFFFPQTPAK